MKRITYSVLFFIVMIMFVSCVSPKYSSYRPQNHTGSAWEIKATKSIGGVLVITINGTEILKGQFSGLYGTKEIEAQYQGRKVKAILIRNTLNTFPWQCDVFIDGDLVDHFKWGSGS